METHTDKGTKIVLTEKSKGRSTGEISNNLIERFITSS